MAAKTPIRAVKDSDGNITGFSEYQSGEFLAVTQGGTGATTATAARTALGISIGSDVQAYDADLAALAALTHEDSKFIVSDGTTWVTESGATVRTSLGLTIGTDVQAYDQQLTDVAGLTPSDGNVIIGDGTNFTTESGSTLRSSLGLAIGSDVQAHDSDLDTIAGLTPTANYIIVGSGSAWTTSNSPTFTNLTVTGNLDVQTEILNTQSEIIVVDDAFVKLNTGNSEVDSGIIVETTDTDDARLFYDVSANRWVLGENQSYDEILTQDSTDTITNKTISGSSNTITNLPNSAFTNSGFDITDGSNSSTISLGDTITFTGGDGVDIAESSGTLTFTTDLSEITSSLNEAIDDRIGSGFVVGGAGVDVAYDDAANTFTLTADLSEVTTDLNERIDDRTAALLIDSSTSGIDISYDDAAGQLTISSDLSEIVESLQDNVQSLFSGGTGITTTYTDGSDDLAISIDFSEFDTDNLVEGSTNLFYTEARFDSSLSGKTTANLTEGSNLYFTDERAQDAVGGMLTGNTETLITVTYDDTNALINFVVDNDLSNYDNSTSGFITATLTQEEVEDFVGGMVSGNTETLIGVTYDDTNGKLDFVVDNDLANYSNTNSAFITLTSLSGSTGVTYDNSTGAISIGQAVGTTDNVTFNNVTVDGTLTSDDITSTNISVAGNATITGNLTVEGTTTTVDSTTVSVGDGMFKFAKDNTGNSTDVGFYGKIVQSSTTKYVGLHWDAGGVNKFKLFDGLTVEPTGTVDTADASYNTATLVADIEGNVTGNLTGNVTGTVSSISNFDTDDLTEGSSNLYYTDARFDTRLATKDTGDLSEGSNLYFTDARAIAALSAGTGITISGAGQIATTITQYADSDVESYLSGGTGIDFSSGVIAIDSTVVTESSTDTLTNKTINFENNTVIVEYAVTASGGNFLIDGEANATISFSPGIVYRFDLSDSSVASHPFKLSTTEDGSHNSGSEYTTGKTSNGSQGSSGAYVEYTVNAATSDILYYYCSSHSGMGGTITVFGSSYGDSDVQSYLSAGSGISISGSGQISSTITQYADSDVQSYLSAGAGISISGSGQISSTITQYADSDVESYLSGGTGVTFSSGSISIGQAVGTSDNVTFNDVTISGNLDVNGTTTTIDTTNTTVTDSIIELANGTTGTPANDAGLVIERGSSDNAFIGFDESADKFIVGTGSFTGASTGNLTISTGTLVANLEGDVTGNVTGNVSGSSGSTTGNAATATALATGRTIGMTGDVVWTSASFDGSGDVTGTATIQSGAIETAMLNANIITGQSTYSGTVDTTNDFVLLYDASSTSLTKIAVSDLNAASGAGTMTDFTIAGDSGSNQTVADSNVLTFTGGTGIDTSIGGTDTVTFAIDNTVITTSSSIGDLSDVDITTSAPTNGQALVWNATNSEFEPGTVASSTNYFQTIAVSGQSDVVPDSTTDTLTFAAGSNITLTTDASTDTVTIAATDTQLTQEQVEDFVNGVIVAGANITKTYDDAAGTLTIAATGGAANAFSTLAVSGQSDVVADSETDTLTFVEGTGMTITTDASTDTITFTSSGGGGGTLPFTDFDGTTDNIVLSSASTGGALPVTLAGGTSDPINMTGTTQTLTSYADDDGDTKVEVERTSDNDTVHIKAGGTDVITATSSGVTITNLTVTGTTTQANELKITDTLFELNADGGSLTTDAGMIVERGSTGDNAAFIWDESTDSWVAGTTATDGSAAANLTVTEGTLKAATQSQGDNSTNVATTAYVDTATAGISSDSIKDADNDTKIEAEASSDADELVFTTGGQERAKMDNNMSMSARGGFFTHNLAMHASETFTIASTEGTVAAGPLDIQGTVDVQGSLVVL